MRTADSLWQAKIVKNNAKNQSQYVRTNQQNEIMKEEQLPKKETRKMCCLDNQSIFNYVEQKLGEMAEEKMEKTDTFNLFKKMSMYIVGGLKKVEANIFKSLIQVVNR